MPRHARQMALFLTLLVAFAATAPGCAKNPASSLYQDGRLFLFVDLDAALAPNRYLTFQAEVESFEPVTITVFDFDNKGTILDQYALDVSKAFNWSEVQGRPIDVLGKVIKGGSEVRVAAGTYGLDNISLPSFRLDGSMSIQLYILDPDAPVADARIGRRLQIRRSTFG